MLCFILENWITTALTTSTYPKYFEIVTTFYKNCKLSYKWLKNIDIPFLVKLFISRYQALKSMSFFLIVMNSVQLFIMIQYIAFISNIDGIIIFYNAGI